MDPFHETVRSALPLPIPDRPAKPRWPTSTAIMAVLFLLLGVAAIASAEFFLLPGLPKVQHARAREAEAVAHARMVHDIDQRLAVMAPLVRQLTTDLTTLRTELRAKLELAGPGPKYADFRSPRELDVLMTKEKLAPVAWSQIESALTIAPQLERFNAELDALFARVRQAPDTSDLALLDAKLTELRAKDQVVKDALAATHHLSVMLDAQRLRPQTPQSKEP